MPGNTSPKAVSSPKWHFSAGVPLLQDDPFWRPDFPVIRPLEGEVERLRQENAGLKRELAAERSRAVLTSLGWESDRRERSRLEEVFFSVFHDFSSWFDSAAFPMTCVGSDGVINQANNRQLDVLGYARNEYIGHYVNEFIPDEEVIRELLDAMAAGRLPGELQASMRCKDGEKKPVLITSEPFRQGISRGLCCYVQDLSEVERCRSDRQKSEGLFRQLTENIREVFWMTSVDKQQMLYVSSAYAAIWGRSCESLYERPTSFLEAIHEEDRERVSRAVVRQGRDDDGYEEEYRVVRPDGTIRWVRDRAFPVRDEEGGIYRIAGLAEDITEAKESQEKLRTRVVQQEALARLGRIALGEISLERVFEEALVCLERSLGVEYVKILRLAPEENSLLLVAGRGWQPGRVGQELVPAGEDSQAGFTLLTREPVIVEDGDRETRFKPPPLLREHGVVSGMSVVIEGREVPFGVLGVHTSQRRQFTRNDAIFLQSVAHILAAFVERCRAEEGRQNLAIRLSRQREKLNDILKNMPAIVWELRLDPESGQLRQAYTSDFAATMIGFTKEDCMENPNLWQERMHPEDRERVKRAMGHVLANSASEGQSGSSSIQFRWMARDERIVWAETTAQALRDEAGNVVGLRGVALNITRRKLAEAGRRDAQERFEDILRNVPGIVWELRLDPKSGDLQPAFVSDFAEAILPGFSREAWMKDAGNFYDRIHPDDREKVKQTMTDTMASGIPAEERFRWVSEDGRTVWLDSYKRVVQDETGITIGLRGVIVDITERMHTEAERQATEARFRDILANVPGVVWEMRIDPATEVLRVVFISDYAETMSGGYAKDKFLKDPRFWIDHVHPDDRETVRARMLAVLEGQPPESHLARWLRPDGRLMWIETKQQAVYDDEGRAIGLRGVTIDVTARKLAEAEREAVEERFQAFMDNSPVAALMKDEDGRYIYGNRPFQTWCKRLGLDWYEADDYDIFPGDLARRYREKDREALEKNTTTQTMEIYYEGDVPKYWSVLRFPVPDASGKQLLGVVAINVTERRGLEREILEISDREQQRLGQELHDGLCQHLLGLALMSKTLADRMNKSEVPQAKEVQTISDFLYEALGLARGLMKGFHLVHVDAMGGLPTALQEFANTTAKLFGKACEFQSDVRFEVLDNEVGTHLYRIAQEATHNAIKHGQPNRVVISLRRVGEDLLLTVENDGSPLPDLSSPRHGMGIRTMRYRADLIGATLSFQNRGEGGVVVTCQIPAGHGIRFVEG